MDTGPIYLAKEFPINQDETTSEVLNRLSIEGSAMTLSVLEMIKNFKQPLEQSIEGASYAPKFQKKDGGINWGASSESIYNLYRALGFNPGIWSVLNGVRIRINNLRRSDVLSDLRPGDINVVNEKMYVGTSDGIIEILELTPAGRNSMTGAEFVRGLTSKVGLHFG
jgi:methionyl-tRNA formyltransferase